MKASGAFGYLAALTTVAGVSLTSYGLYLAGASLRQIAAGPRRLHALMQASAAAAVVPVAATAAAIGVAGTITLALTTRDNGER